MLSKKRTAINIQALFVNCITADQIQFVLNSRHKNSRLPGRCKIMEVL
jgi:hypothetical protein